MFCWILFLVLSTHSIFFKRPYLGFCCFLAFSLWSNSVNLIASFTYLKFLGTYTVLSGCTMSQKLMFMKLANMFTSVSFFWLVVHYIYSIVDNYFGTNPTIWQYPFLISLSGLRAVNASNMEICEMMHLEPQHINSMFDGRKREGMRNNMRMGYFIEKKKRKLTRII